MNLEDFTKSLREDVLQAIRCAIPNSEGKAQRHDWSDTYKRWGWQKWKWGWIKWWPARLMYRKCIRCDYEVRRLQ